MRKRHETIFKIGLVSVLILSLSSFMIVSDNEEPFVRRIEMYLQKLRKDYAVEKVYLHLDKPYYMAGETVWIKAYLQDASHLKQNMGSNVLYIDLTEESGKLVTRLTLKAEAGLASGSVSLPTSLTTGRYGLTAYTNWMRNFGEEYYFQKDIHVRNSTDRIIKKTNGASPKEKIDLQFFPEGGDMISGLASKVAFKAVNGKGQGVSVQGTLYNQDGERVLNIKSFHLGMGAFDFTPQQGKNYLVKVTDDERSIQTYPLPEALAQGYTLAVDETSHANFIMVKVATNFESPSPLLLTAISQNQLMFTEVIKWKGNRFEIEVPKNIFPTGIVRFTLSQLSGELHAERLAFIDHNDELQLTIRTNRKTYGLREKVTMDIEAKNAKGQPVSIDFSLAVTDDGLSPSGVNASGIVSNLLLTSDVKGYVEQPNYYFIKPTAESIRALSYLMMTQGWRRFGWLHMYEGQYPELKYGKEMGLSVQGKLVTRSGKPIINGEVILYLKDQHTNFLVEETNERGEFMFDGFDFTDSVSLVIQGIDSRGGRDLVEVVMQETDYLPVTKLSGVEELQPALGQEYLETSTRQIQSLKESQSLPLGDVVLKEIVIESTRLKEPFKLHTSADVVLRGDQLPVPPSGNVLEVLDGRVAGLQILRRGNYFKAVIRGQGEPLYLIDGVPVNASELSTISSYNIETIEVIKGPEGAGIYGGQASGGVIAFYTKRAGPSFTEIDETGKKFVIVHRAGGYSKVREFYSPEYVVSQENKQADLRSTVYWNPSIVTDGQGKAQIVFYTADLNTQYRAVAEGISKEGKPGRGEYVFNVQQSNHPSPK